MKSPTEINLAISEFHWRERLNGTSFRQAWEAGLIIELPDYLNDLDAMRDAEKMLTGIQRADYFFALDQELGLEAPYASAPVRAIALLKAADLWGSPSNP